MLFEQYAERRLQLATQRGTATDPLHGHCHQKSMGLLPPAKALLSRIPGCTVIDPDAGCCGMAGSFGYSARTLRSLTADRRTQALSRDPRPQAGNARRRVRRLLPSPSQRFHRRIRHPSRSTAAVTSQKMNLDLAWLSLAGIVRRHHHQLHHQAQRRRASAALAWIIGVYLGGFKIDEVAAGFPVAAIPDARRRDDAVLPGADQRHARQARA